MIEIIQQPWPWYIAGPLIGLTVPILLIIGNKTFGISSSMRHICAACLPANITFFKYEWKKEIWNLLFVLGIFIGGFLGVALLSNPEPMIVDENLQSELAGYGISNYNYLVPPEIFSWQNLFSLQGFIMMVLGGFMIGFGTRYAGGCTSGHAIMGLSMLQWPSLIATCCFMIGGFIMANLIIPFILAL
jgi:uncharacterized membrane protein YedE/YeeE